MVLYGMLLLLSPLRQIAKTKKSINCQIPLQTKMVFLEKFQEKKGHLRVPTMHESLGIWVQELRRCAKTCQRNEEPKFNYLNKAFKTGHQIET
jgi:hypothetical protein